MRFAMKAVAAAVAARHGHRNCVAAPPELPAPKSKHKKKIQPSLFGMHAHELSDPSPQVHPSLAPSDLGQRCSWDEVNTAPGVYD